jgi:hypothetical protein
MPESYLPLDFLQIWDVPAYDVTVIEKPLLKGLRAEFLGKSGHFHKGVYMFTLDGCNPDPRVPDFGFSESPDEHKSYNLLALDNGQYALHGLEGKHIRLLRDGQRTDPRGDRTRGSL